MCVCVSTRPVLGRPPQAHLHWPKFLFFFAVRFLFSPHNCDVMTEASRTIRRSRRTDGRRTREVSLWQKKSFFCPYFYKRPCACSQKSVSAHLGSQRVMCWWLCYKSQMYVDAWAWACWPWSPHFVLRPFFLFLVSFTWLLWPPEWIGILVFVSWDTGSLYASV